MHTDTALLIGRTYEICKATQYELRETRKELKKTLDRIEKGQAMARRSAWSNTPSLEKWAVRVLQVIAPLATLYMTGSLEKAWEVFSAFGH